VHQGPSFRRNHFRRPADYAAVALIVVASVVVWFVLWTRSDIHNTALVTGPSNVATPAAPTAFPPSLAEFWVKQSGATPQPVVVGPSVIVADGGRVAGVDPQSGNTRWSYTRDLPLCTVTSAFDKALVLYRRSTCSEVTELDGTTGARGAQRNGNAQSGARVLYDGTYVTTTGSTLLNTWRSDLVQTVEYGKVPDFVNPKAQPRTGCTYGSVAAANGVIGVIERCDRESGDRLTLYKATPKDADHPLPTFSTIIGDRGSRLIAFNDKYGVVVAPNPARLVVFNAVNGAQVTSYPLTLGAKDLQGDPPGLVVPTSTGTNSVFWFTGSQTIALSTTDYHIQWTMQGTLGAGTTFAGRYLVPVKDAIDVLDVNTGTTIGSIGVDRHGYTGTVAMASLGPVVFEQRGGQLAALH
jgi:hypothetical protein